MRIYLGISAVALLIGPLILLEYDYQWSQSFGALLLLCVCAYPTARYFAHGESSLPTMPIFCLAYALQFGIPLFTHDDTFLLAGAEVKSLDYNDVMAATVIAIIGITALQIGYYAFQKSNYTKVIPIAHLPLRKSKALYYCAIVGVLLPIVITFKGIIPEELQQPLSSLLRLLQNQVLVVIGILGWLVYGRRDSKFYTIWLYSLVLIVTLRGISSGNLEEALVPIGVLFVVKWLYVRRVPIGPILATLALVIFLSPVKSDYRQQAWFGEDAELAEQSSLVKGATWIEQAAEYWKDTWEGQHDFSEATASASGRVDFIHQMAHIYSLTPSVVPFQYGKTYSFFAVALIPRVLWPDKPTAGSANGFYAVTYGVTTEEGAKTTTFGISILGEAFINFGWIGVVFVMLFEGVLIAVMHHSFGQAVFLAFFVYFLNGIGSSAEIMFGGILQNLLCGYILLLWSKDKRSELLPRSSELMHRFTSLARHTTTP